MRPRQVHRQHSKSNLVRAAAILYETRSEERRKWRIRMAWTIPLAIAFGVAVGATLVRL